MRRSVPSLLTGSLGVSRPIKPVDIGENGNVVIADFADTGQPALPTLAERNICRWKPRAETSTPLPSRTRNPSWRAPMRHQSFRCWTGNAACAASSAANRPSGSRIWAPNRFSPSFGSATPFRNPVTAWRFEGMGPGGNFCSCPDYATAELGTCKHIEFTLSRLEKKRGARTAFARGYQPAFSELYLRNDGKRRVHFRAGTDCPPTLIEAAAGLFDAEHDGMLPEERLGELEHFWSISRPRPRSAVTSFVPMTMPSISSPADGMQSGGPRSSSSCSHVAPQIPSCWRF